MSSTRNVIKRELLQNSLTIEELLEDLEQGCGTKMEIMYVLNSMMRSGEVRLEEDSRLYINDAIEGKTVAGTINKDGDWEPMISIPISEYEELVEIRALYEANHS